MSLRQRSYLVEGRWTTGEEKVVNKLRTTLSSIAKKLAKQNWSGWTVGNWNVAKSDPYTINMSLTLYAPGGRAESGEVGCSCTVLGGQAMVLAYANTSSGKGDEVKDKMSSAGFNGAVFRKWFEKQIPRFKRVF